MEKDINNLQICMTGMKKDIEFIKVSLFANKEEHKEMMKKIEKWIGVSEKRFAPMWVATVLKYVMGVIGLAIIGAVLSQILI